MRFESGHDPLVGAVCDPEEVWQMTDEMLVAQAEWLPQYAAAMPSSAGSSGGGGSQRHPCQDDPILQAGIETLNRTRGR